MSKLTPAAGQRILDTDRIRKALLSKAGPAKWNDEDAYVRADQAESIGNALCEQVHRHLRTERTGYLFKKKLGGRGEKITMAKASIVSPKLKFFAELDFLVDISWEVWMHLEPHQRVALIDHELSHFGIDETDKGEKVRVIFPHDVEEFDGIIRRWGFWKPDVANFAGAVREQLELLGPKA